MRGIWKLFKASPPTDPGETSSVVIGVISPNPACAISWPTPRHESLHVLGSGGTAQVELVEDRWLARRVARKTLSEDADPDQQQRFLDEARRLAALDHPGVPAVFDVGVDSAGQPYCLQRHVAGITLGKLIRQHFANASPDWPDYLRRLQLVGLRLAEVLAHAHQRGFIHADIKPDNVLVGEFGEVFLIDWGMPSRDGRLEGLPPGMIAGTPAYMAPEQARGEPDRVDARTDIFLVGATLYHGLAGVPPFRAEDFAAVIHQAIEARCPPLNLPHASPAAERLQAITERCMRRSAPERYRDAAALRRDLESMSVEEPPV